MKSSLKTITLNLRKKMILKHDFILQEQFFKKIAQLFQDGGLDIALTDTEDEQLLFSYSK